MLKAKENGIFSQTLLRSSLEKAYISFKKIFRFFVFLLLKKSRNNLKLSRKKQQHQSQISKLIRMNSFLSPSSSFFQFIIVLFFTCCQSELQIEHFSKYNLFFKINPKS